ncbi:hypothetical protein LSCM1_07449 [Leishmania martiniquensis]|uniref:Uncharacterized protein n=1 Tax=Leishmania martiniquensis TaxID=1580590 RepID=A0A836H9U9_9TRYP|nr:hypothetical protein LSCM1_07449 [Leishmania martiniquensis]
MKKLAHVCLVALLGYALAGLAGAYFLVRFRRLHCVRQVQPWHLLLHYVCYGGILTYLISAALVQHRRSGSEDGEGTASVWGVSLSQSLLQKTVSEGILPTHFVGEQPAGQPSPASRRWQVCELLGQVVLHAFLSPWTRVTPAPSILAAKATTVSSCCLYEPFVQAIAATAFFSSFALLCNVRWRYAVMGMAERQPDLWRSILAATATKATAAGPKGGAALAEASDELEKHTVSILDGSGSSTVATVFPLISGGAFGVPSILSQRAIAVPRRRRARAPSYVASARDLGHISEGGLDDSVGVTSIAATPTAVEGSGGDGYPVNYLRAYHAKRRTGRREATAAPAAGVDGTPVEAAAGSGSGRTFEQRSLRHARLRQQYPRVTAFCEDDYDDIDDDGDGVLSSAGLSSQASGMASSSSMREREEPSRTGSGVWRRLRHFSGWRLWPFSARECEEGSASTPRNGPFSLEEHCGFQHLCERLLAAFWLSDTLVVLLTFLTFALLAVARVAVAVAVASAWAATEALTAEESQGPVHGKGGGRQWMAATVAAAVLPRPTEGFVGLAGLLLLAAERALLRRWMRLLQQIRALSAAAAFTSLAASAAHRSTLAARQQHFRQRQLRRSSRKPGSGGLRSSTDFSPIPSTDQPQGVETAGSAASVTMETMTLVPFRFRYVLTVALLLLSLQFFSDATWAWAAAVLLTVASAVASLANTVAGPLHWVSTEYRSLVGRTWWELFFACSFTPFSLDLLNAHGQHVMGSMLEAMPVALGEQDFPAAAGKGWLACRGNATCVAVSTTALSPFSIRHRRYSTAQRIARVRSGGGRGPLGMLSRHGAPFYSRAVGCTSSLSAPSAVAAAAAAATLLTEDAVGAVSGDGHEGSGLLSGDAPHSHGMASGGAATAISPIQFWHNVAVKVLQQSGKATSEVAGAAELGGGEDGSSVGVVTVAAAAAEGAPVDLRRSFTDGGSLNAGAVGLRSGWAAAEDATAALLNPAPIAGPLPTLSTRPDTEHLSPAAARFTRESLKKSMLLALPTVARMGGKVESAEVELRDRLAVTKRAEPRPEEVEEGAPRWPVSDAIAFGSTRSDEDEERLPTGRPSVDPAVPGALDSAGEAQQQSGARDGWLSRALTTVVSSLAATRCSSGCIDGDGAEVSSSQPDSASEALSVSLINSFSSSFGSSAARAPIDDEEGFERFLDCVRRDGDNTYALQSLLAVYGNTYGQRVDAKGRGALHYAAMGGFVHGAVFLGRIGAEPNVLDKAGYAPLHYAVLYHTEARLPPHIAGESPSAAAQGAPQVLGIPVLETTTVQAAEQAKKRQRRHQQQQLEWVQAQLQAAYSAGSDPASVAGSRIGSCRGPQQSAPATSSHMADASAAMSSTPGKSLTALPLPIFIPPLVSLQSSKGVGSTAAGSTSSAVADANSTAIPMATTAATAAAAAVAAVVVPEEKEEWCGMIGALVHLGAQVDLPTAKWLTALHLAVMQGSVGLVNILLREGANPLLGSELETQSLGSTIDTVARCDSDSDDVVVRSPRKAFLQRRHRRQSGIAATMPSRQQWQAPTDTPQVIGRRGRATSSLVSSESDNLHATRGDASRFLATFAQRRHWVDIHVSNAGHPITNGHSKSPLLLAVELDADLAVASMLRHAALSTVARMVAGLSPMMLPVARVPEQLPPASLPAPPGAPSIVTVVSMASDSLASRVQGWPPPASLPVTTTNIFASHSGPSVAAASFADRSTSSALLYHPSPWPATHPLADSVVEDAAIACPLPIAEAAAAAAAAASTTASSGHAHRPGSRLMSPRTAGIADASLSSSVTTAPMGTTPHFSSPQTWWERCCLHDLNPLHIALALGNAQVTRVLLLQWCYAEDVTRRHDAAASLHTSVSSAGRLGGKGREPRMTTIAALALPESVLVATATVPPLLPAAGAVTSTAATVAPDDAGSILTGVANGAASSFCVDVVAAEQQQQQQQPVLAHITVPLAEEAEGSPLGVSVSGGGGAAAAAPTATLSLVPSTGSAAFWVPPLRLNLFHFAAVGDSTECLAYVLRWRGAPDYVPCSLDGVFHDDQQTESPRRASTMAQEAHQHHRQQKRLRVHTPSEAAVAPAEQLAFNAEDGVFTECQSSSSTSATGANHIVASDGEVTAAEAATLVTNVGEQDGVSKQLRLLPAATATSQVPARVVAVPRRLRAPSSVGSRTMRTADTAVKAQGDGIASSATSDTFDQAWSSSSFSDESSSADNAAAAPATSRRERCTRAQQQAFVRALVTLLQANIRADVVRARVRTALFGSSSSEVGDGGVGAISRSPLRRPYGSETLQKTVRPLSAKVHHQSLRRPREGGVDDEGSDGSSDSIVMAKTCFGSTAAAAALHTGMAVCYATMSHPLDHHQDGFRSEKGAGHSSPRSSSSGGNVQRRIDEDSVAPRAPSRQTKGADRLRYLRQQRSCAFVSAVAKLRQSITGVPIDIAHLAAVETAVDRTCARMTSASARRSLQEALLIVTQRLQNQHRRARLATGLSCVAAAATAAVDAASADGDGSASRAESDSESAAITTASATVGTSTEATRNAGGKDGDDEAEDRLHAAATATAGKGESSMRHRQSTRRRSLEAARHSISSRGSSSSYPCPGSPLAQSYYSAPHSITTTTATNMHESCSAGPAERAWACASDAESRCRSGQESTLRLLRALSLELNAIDTRGLTPLHYAIANQSASMVYLLCAYGATFVFASEETESYLTRHSAEVIAATVAADRHSGGGDAETFVKTGMEPATSQEGIPRPTATTSPTSPATLLLPTAWTSARALRSAPAVTVATDALLSLGEHYYAQLTPSTQEALRQAAKSGAAKHLLYRMPTQEECEAERRQLPPPSASPVSEAVESASDSRQHRGLPPTPHPPPSPAVPTNKTADTSAVCAHVRETRSPPSPLSPVAVPPARRPGISQQPATMAVTLTAALGISNSSPVRRAAAAAPPDACLVGEKSLGKTTMMASGAGADSDSRDAPLAHLQAYLIEQEAKALQSMVAGKAGRSRGNDGSGGGTIASLRSPPQYLRRCPNADGSLEAKGEATVALNAVAGGPSRQSTARETPLQCNASNSSASTTTAAMHAPAATTTDGVAVSPTSPADADYTLLEPHDVFLTHVVRDPAKADSMVRAAIEGTALRYLFLASLVSRDPL